MIYCNELIKYCTFSFRSKSCLLDYETAKDAGTSGFRKSRSNHQKYYPNERFNIGKHAPEFGTVSTLPRFKAEFLQLRESTVRSIRSKYEEEFTVALK